MRVGSGLYPKGSGFRVLKLSSLEQDYGQVSETKSGLELDDSAGKSPGCRPECLQGNASRIGIRVERLQIQTIENIIEIGTYLDSGAFTKKPYIRQPESLHQRQIGREVSRAGQTVAADRRWKSKRVVRIEIGAEDCCSGHTKNSPRPQEVIVRITVRLRAVVGAWTRVTELGCS